MKYRVAVGSSDGAHVDEHFGRGKSFFIYEIDQETGGEQLLEVRRFVSAKGVCGSHDNEEALEKINSLKDCQIVLVVRIGTKSEKLLTLKGVIPLQREGSIASAFEKIKRAYKNRVFQ
jgi:predicted Fe-Mo cluster-binding NifX family protein